MQLTFWFSVLAGYLLGAGAAAAVLPAATMAAAALPLAVATGMLVAAVAVAAGANRVRPGAGGRPSVPPPPPLARPADDGAAGSPTVEPETEPQPARRARPETAEPPPALVAGTCDRPRVVLLEGPAAAVRADGPAPGAEEPEPRRLRLAVVEPPLPPSPPPDSLAAAEIGRALDEGRVEVFVQPIVSLPQRRAAFYEGFTRIRDGSRGLVLPARYLPRAEAAGLIGRIDLTLLAGCARALRRDLVGADRRVRVFCNVSPKSLDDPAFVAGAAEFLAGRPEVARRLVLELGHGGLGAAASDALQSLRRLGVGVSLDRPQEGGPGARELARLGVGFVKLGAKRFEAAAGRSELDPELLGLHEDLRAAGIAPIADRIESERALVEVLDYPVPYGQGYLFGAPERLAA